MKLGKATLVRRERFAPNPKAGLHLRASELIIRLINSRMFFFKKFLKLLQFSELAAATHEGSSDHPTRHPASLKPLELQTMS
jgi:hypothetical protein